MMRASVVVLGLVACSSAPTPPAAPAPGPRPVAGGTTAVRPLAFAADAKRGDAALILGTDERGGSTVVPLAQGEQRVSVDSLYFVTGGAGAPTGGMGAVELTAATSSAGQVRVGIFEDVSGGLGPSWRAGVWTASLVAADVLGKDLTDLTFTASASGRVDGASASGLMTAGYLAALLGQPIATDATMTGTINPDGTFGPVGGIPQKFLAAIAKGKKRLGYPLGMRQSVDLATGETVDLEELARAHGATAVEVADVYAALTLLTGHQLARPVPVTEEMMAVPAPVATALTKEYEHWHDMLAGAWPRVLELAASPAVPPAVRTLAQGAIADLAAGERLHAAGAGAAAVRLLARAWFGGATAASTDEVLALVRAGDVPGAIARLDEFEGLAAVTDDAIRALGEVKPKTMGDHLELVSAFERTLTGWGFRSLASSSLLPQARAALASVGQLTPVLRVAPATIGEVTGAVLPAVAAVARSIVASGQAATALEVEAATSLDYSCSLPNVRRLATSYKAAAASNLAYLDALFVAQLAEALSVTLDQAKLAFANREPGYLVAMITANVGAMSGFPAELKAAWGEDSIAWGLFTLAAGELSFADTSALISEYYSLQVEYGPDGTVTGVEHPEAFAHILAWAERRTREQARAALVATGAIPVQTQLHYQIARTQAAGDLAEQLGALRSYWAATRFAQTAVMLARN
ncbi:MAG: S16 family serine protease [Kofleriaceae bacterium]